MCSMRIRSPTSRCRAVRDRGSWRVDARVARGKRVRSRRLDARRLSVSRPSVDGRAPHPAAMYAGDHAASHLSLNQRIAHMSNASVVHRPSRPRFIGFSARCFSLAAVSCGDDTSEPIAPGFLGGTSSNHEIGVVVNSTGKSVTLFQLGSPATQQQIALGTSSTVTPTASPCADVARRFRSATPRASR